MEKEGMELLDEEEQEVPHAEVMPPMMEKVEVGECDDDLAQPDDLGFQRASEVDDTDIATYPDLSLKQELVEGLAVNLQKTHKKRAAPPCFLAAVDRIRRLSSPPRPHHLKDHNQ